MEVNKMQRQKRGFWLFICSLIPGAGEMHMGFMKQGVSIMLLFWGIVGISAGLNLGFLTIFLPIIWFYSFFHVHNLKSLPADEFYTIEDDYILHLDRIFGNTHDLYPKYRKILAVLMILLGIVILWNNFTSILYWILPDYLADFLYNIIYRLPQIIIAAAIIMTGYYILSGRKKSLEKDETHEDEDHYWQPYRPYQQPNSVSEKPLDEVSFSELSHSHMDDPHTDDSYTDDSQNR